MVVHGFDEAGSVIAQLEIVKQDKTNLYICEHITLWKHL
jgi:hypothetical protein